MNLRNCTASSHARSDAGPVDVQSDYHLNIVQRAQGLDQITSAVVDGLVCVLKTVRLAAKTMPRGLERVGGQFIFNLAAYNGRPATRAARSMKEGRKAARYLKRTTSEKAPRKEYASASTSSAAC